MNCERCGGTAPSWLGGVHKCPQDFTRRRYVKDTGWIDVPEPHDMAQWLHDYDTTHHLGHAYPSFAWPE